MRRLLLFGLLIFAGCASDQKIKRLPPPTPLRLTLVAFADTFAVRVEKTADDIAARRLSNEINRNTVFWKMRAIPLIREPLVLADDKVVLLGMWMTCARMLQFFEEGLGKEIFGEATPAAVKASKELVAEIVALASANLTEEQQTDAKQQIASYIDGHPIGGTYGITTKDKVGWFGVIGGVLDKSVHAIATPLRHIDPTGGLSDTASAVHRVAATVDLLTTQVKYLPDKLRWDTELALYELDENQAVITALASFKQVSETAASLAGTVSGLPKELRQVLEEVEQGQPELQKTLEEARATIEGVDRTAQSLTQMGQVWTGTLDSAAKITEEFSQPDKEPTPPEEKGPPFDINDYGRTAEQLTQTTNAIAALLERVEALADPKEAGTLLDTADSAIDRVLMRAGLFLLFLLVVVLGYRQIDRRLARSSRA